MSGHSKWATTHRQKEVKDAKRGAIFTKIANLITVAAKSGGGPDPDANFKLRLVIEKAKQMNMPKENINRAIERATGAGAQDLSEGYFEGFLPGGGAVMIQVLTDNKLRIAQQIRMILDKSGGSLAGQGAVSYLFELKGEILAKCKDAKLSMDDQELAIIDLGVDEIGRTDDSWEIYCDKDMLFMVKESLEKLGYAVDSAELVMKPVSFTETTSDEQRQRIDDIVDKLDELDDVQRVFTNLV